MTNRMPPVVRTLSPDSSPPITVSHPRLTFIGTPELYPGTIRGPSSDQKHSSKGGAIAGGILGTIAAVSIIVAASLYFRRRRRSLASSAADAGDGALNLPMGQSQRPMSGQGVIASSFPRTATSPMTPYVSVFVLPSSACVCSCVFLFFCPQPSEPV
jgi:hypothetical protein